MLAASLIYWSKQPPCASFIDGPCGNREAIFGFWWWAYLLSAAAIAALALAWAVAAAVHAVKKRRTRLPL